MLDTVSDFWDSEEMDKLLAIMVIIGGISSIVFMYRKYFYYE